MIQKNLKIEATKLVATFFYIGFIPLAPGTFGSLAGLALAWFCYPGLLTLLAVMTTLGFWAAAPAENYFGRKDPSFFVMDEVCGMMVSVCWLPRRLSIFFCAFLFFRFFDILKPWPIRQVDRQPQASAIMWDDLLAGIFANVCVQLAGRWMGWI